MAQDGEVTVAVLTCRRDGVSTRLRCAECDTPICPACFVRTEVGLMCPACGADTTPAILLPTRRRRAFAAAALTGVALLAAGGGWLVTRPGTTPAPEVDIAAGSVKTVALFQLGSGQLPDGTAWRLDARRDGQLCVTLTVAPTRPGERCQDPPGNKTMASNFTRVLTGPNGSTYLTWGIVSEQVDRVRVAPDGDAPWEVPALGAGAGLGGRIFVFSMAHNVPVTFTALSAEGREIGHQARPALPTR